MTYSEQLNAQKHKGHWWLPGLVEMRMLSNSLMGVTFYFAGANISWN